MVEHQFETEDGLFRCRVCGRSWKYQARHDCPGVHQYEWGQAPENLKTARELREMGLKPTGKPAGCLWWNKRSRYIWLYDVAQAEARPAASEKQLAALERARAAKTCKGCGTQVGRKRRLRGGYCHACATVIWARECLADAETRVLDTETTGLYDDAQIVEIAVLNTQGDVLLDTLVRPDEPIPADAARVHGITDEMAAGAPAWTEIWPQVVEAIRGKRVIAYNAEFDRRMVTQTRKRFGIEEPSGTARWDCLMETYMEWMERERWCSLSAACAEMRVQAGGHRALGDAQATLGLLRAIAGVKLEKENGTRINAENAEEENGA